MVPTQIAFLLLPHIHLLDLAGPDQVFLEAQDYGVNIHVRYCSHTEVTEELITSSRLPFGNISLYKDIQFHSGDYLIVPGADMQYLTSKEFRSEYSLFHWIREQYANGVHICSVCTGAFVLGEAGILSGKRCTTHWKRIRELEARFLSADVQENVLYTEDSGIFTSAGVASGIDLALHIVSKLADDYVAFKVARELVIYTRRPAHQVQHSVFLSYRNHIHSGIHTVQDWLQENLHQKTTLEDLADIACMSSRSLTRIFKQETGITVNDYITLLRKERIEKLLKNPDMTKAEIAEQCGLQSERQVARLMKS